jgi:hypothetical protein
MPGILEADAAYERYHDIEESARTLRMSTRTWNQDAQRGAWNQ